ncbi:exported hypothetical protein [uncultured Paludibacter sp.]|nr:exported hypothetical protein [uncultured Paludibacter sp.]
MKKITLLLLALSMVSLTNAVIWVNPLTTGRPISTYYLGDKLSSPDWYFNFEIGQASWDKSEVGIGQNPDGVTGWDWADANWYQDGSGSNKQVRRNIGGFQFTATGEWYVVGRARAVSTDPWTYADEGGWTDETTLTCSTTSKSCPYFSVSALSNPSSLSSSNVGVSTLDLSWAKWNSRNVMIVRFITSAGAANSPVQGTAYSVGSTLGTGTVVYNGDATSFSDSGLSASTNYTYVFYSENYSYYSDGASINVTTSVLTGVNKLESSLKLSGNDGKVTARFDGAAKIELYSATGQLIRSANAINEFSEAVKTGMYLVRIDGITHKLIVK